MDRYKEISLLEKVKKGNQEAFKEIFNIYYSRLCLYVEKLVNRKDIAEEIVQTIFLKIWENRTKIIIKISLKSYLFKSVHNHALKYLHSKKLEEAFLVYNKELLEKSNLDLPNTELTEAINRSIDELPEKCKEIFILSRFEHLKHLEIAEKLGISAKTVEMQIRNANIKLKNKLKDFMN